MRPAEDSLRSFGTRKAKLYTALGVLDAQPFSSFLPTAGQGFPSSLGRHPASESLAAFLYQIRAGLDVLFHCLFFLKFDR